MNWDRGYKIRWTVALVMSACSAFDFFVGLLSGSLADDTGEAAKTAVGLVSFIPPWANVAIFLAAAGLLLYGPVMRWYAKAERSILGVPDPQPPRGPQARPTEPVVVQAAATTRRPFPMLGWTDELPPMTCPRCEGTACDWGRYERPCKMCKATGELPGVIAQYEKCKYCDGKGCDAGRYERPCQVCGGYGHRIAPEIAERVIREFFAARKL